MSATTSTLLTSSLRQLTHLVPPQTYSKQFFGQQSCLTFTKTVWLHLPGPQSVSHKVQQAAFPQGRVRWRLKHSPASNLGLLCQIRSLWLAENITWGIICKSRATRAKSTLATVSHQSYCLSCSTSKSSHPQTETRMSKDFRINPERRDSAAFPFHK